MANRVILIRHGDLAKRCRGRYVGRTDEPLSAAGRRQAAALAGRIAHIKGAHFWASPLRRTRETAQIALGHARALKKTRFEQAVQKCSLDENLREIDFGRWEGMSFAEIAAADPAAVEKWAEMDDGFAFPGGESIADFRERIRAAAERIEADPAGTVVIFTHGGVIRFLICHLLGLPHRQHLIFDIGPASVSEIRIDGARGVLTLLNDRHHLEGC